MRDEERVREFGILQYLEAGGTDVDGLRACVTRMIDRAYIQFPEVADDEKTDKTHKSKRLQCMLISLYTALVAESADPVLIPSAVPYMKESIEELYSVLAKDGHARVAFTNMRASYSAKLLGIGYDPVDEALAAYRAFLEKNGGHDKAAGLPMALKIKKVVEERRDSYEKVEDFCMRYNPSINHDPDLEVKYKGLRPYA